MSQLSKGIVTKKLSINVIVPYWRNPRQNDEAVEMVKKSIEQYGYQQPIMVDEKNVIIAGHTRYRALMQLGYEEVDVIVSDMPAKKAKEYRIIDNRTSEYATWTNELVLELKEFESLELAEAFFPEVKLDLGFSNSTGITPITQEQIDAIGDKKANEFSSDNDHRSEGKLELMCPYCHEHFELERSYLSNDSVWER
jgi:ParB-like chromosome segregation protein Spo0J